MTRIAIAGAAGRMGQAIIRVASGDDRLEITHAFEEPGHGLLETDVGSLVGSEPMGITITDTVESRDFDVLIDFTSPMATMSHVEYCKSHGRQMVIGTTGLDPSQQYQIGSVSDNMGIVMAPNMSIGINLTLKLIELAARVLGDSVDIEIIEAHHRHKVDAPSGTALRMGEVVAETLGRNLETDGLYSRYGQIGERKNKEIGFSTIRAGDVVGEHSVWFVSSGERVEITHKATSRAIYASGAVRAALWLVDRPNGLYDMYDVLGLSA
jgi:4-hydroxy-tetrahydrodipicolinate reductase